MTRLLWTVAVLTVLAAFGDAGATSGNEATPAPDVPPPELCTVAPRTYDAMSAIAATAVASPPPARTPGPVPEGNPADNATVAGISATVREYVACFNAGEPLRAYALHTDASLAHILAQQGLPTEAGYAALATPEPSAPEERTAIISIADARVFTDGSAGAMVTLSYPSIRVPKSFFFTFVRSGDRWLIDGILGEIAFSVP
jgi:hypothetical protein